MLSDYDDVGLFFIKVPVLISSSLVEDNRKEMVILAESVVESKFFLRRRLQRGYGPRTAVVNMFMTSHEP